MQITKRNQGEKIENFLQPRIPHEHRRKIPEHNQIQQYNLKHALESGRSREAPAV